VRTGEKITGAHPKMAAPVEGSQQADPVIRGERLRNQGEGQKTSGI